MVYDRVCAFSAKVVNVNIIATLLKSIAFCEKVNVFISTAGFKFTVEEGKYVQATAFFNRDIFQEFVLNNDEDLAFKVPLKEMLEFLKMFCIHDGRSSTTTLDTMNATTAAAAATTAVANNTNTHSMSGITLKIQYECVGGPFSLILEENGAVTDFHLRTEETDDLMDLDLDPLSCRLILKSDPMKDLFSEIDNNGPEYFKFKIIPKSSLQLIGKVICGRMKIIIPESSIDVIECFECDILTKATYKFSILKYSFKALNLSEKVALKMSSNGILCLSFLMSSSTESYVEFFCLSHVPPEEPVEEGVEDEETEEPIV